MALGAAFINRLMYMALIQHAAHFVVAIEADLVRGSNKLIFIFRCMGIMANIAVATSDRPMDKILAERLGIVAIITEICGLAFERILKIALMGIMASDTISIQHRFMDVILQHHIAARFMTSQT